MNKSLTGIMFVALTVLAPVAVFAIDQASGMSVFTRNLTVGSRGSEVSMLQERLISEGFLVSDVTGYFGPLTRDAVKKFQAAHGIDMVGIVGPQTRAALNASSASTQTGDVLGVSAFNFTLDLAVGSTGDEVAKLQERLMKEGLLSGESAGYFGTLTRDAVKAFQANNQIETTGNVGPRTRAILNKAVLQ